MEKKLLLLLFGFFPLFFLAESSSSSMLEFLKGDGAFEAWFMEVFSQMDSSIESSATSASLLGRSIGGIGALIYLGYLGYQMLEGLRPWAVTPMLRPIIIGLILIHWVSFTSLIQYPLEKLAAPSRDVFFSLEKDANLLRVKRFEKQSELLDFLVKHKAEEQAKEKELSLSENSGISAGIVEGMSALFLPLEEWRIRMDFKLQKLAADLIESLSLTVLRVATYLIFFIQKIWSYVLVVLGPLAIGLSLVPGFDGSFNEWLKRFINVNLYGFIAYTVINIGQQLIMAGYTLEIERYEVLLSGAGDLGAISYYISQNGMISTVLFPCVAYLVTGIGVLMTPIIADSILAAGSAGVISAGRAAAGDITRT